MSSDKPDSLFDIHVRREALKSRQGSRDSRRKPPVPPEFIKNWFWIFSSVAIILSTTFFSVKEISPGEVAVKVNNLMGTQSAVNSPGWTIRIPLLQSVYIMDAKPQTFLMKGDKDLNNLHVRELTVRASDGSNFHFTDTTIIFQLNGFDVVEAVEASGTDDGIISWMKPYARSILRDEFGRESTIDVSNPTTYGAAANRAKERLNTLLKTKGIIVNQLVTPRPLFNDSYEQAIEDRNSLSNQLEVIRSDLDRAKTDRDRQLAEMDKQKNRVVQETRAQLESELASAIAEQAGVKQATDTFRIEVIGKSRAFLAGSIHRAKELEGELLAKLQAKEAEILAFREQPVERLMEQLGHKLKDVTINIQPWAQDAAPQTINLNKQGE